MKLKDLTKPTQKISKKKKGQSAASTWKYLEANEIPFEKIFREDETGADFLFVDSEDAGRVYNELLTHKKINKNFTFKWDGSDTVNVYFKD